MFLGNFELCLNVAELRRALEFYETLGFKRVGGNILWRFERVGVLAGENHVGVDIIPVNPAAVCGHVELIISVACIYSFQLETRRVFCGGWNSVPFTLAGSMSAAVRSSMLSGSIRSMRVGRFT